MWFLCAVAHPSEGVESSSFCQRQSKKNEATRCHNETDKPGRSFLYYSGAADLTCHETLYEEGSWRTLKGSVCCFVLLN